MKVSIIIPAYNADKHIERCLNSVKAQTFKDVEVLIVDDNSGDSTSETVNKWSSENTDIVCRYFKHDENQGVASARNTGLEHAIGEYVYFLDADDYIDPILLEDMVKYAQTENLDIVGCEWYLSFDEKERHIKQKDVSNGVELFKSFANGVSRWNLWLFLVKRALYMQNNIRFIPQMNMGEDLMVMGKLALLSDGVRIIHKPYYHYVQTNSEALTKKWNDATRAQVSQNVLELENFIKLGDYQDLVKYIQFLKLNIKLPYLISDNKSDYKIWKEWFPEADAYIGEIKELPVRTKILMRAAKNNMFWYVALYYKLIYKFVYGVIYK